MELKLEHNVSLTDIVPSELCEDIILLSTSGTDGSTIRVLRLIDRKFRNVCQRHLYDTIVISNATQLEHLSANLTSIALEYRIIRNLFIVARNFRRPEDETLIPQFINAYAAPTVVNMGIVFDPMWNSSPDIQRSILSLSFPALRCLALGGSVHFTKAFPRQTTLYPALRSFHHSGTTEGKHIDRVFPTLASLRVLTHTDRNFWPNIELDVTQIRKGELPETAENRWPSCWKFRLPFGIKYLMVEFTPPHGLANQRSMERVRERLHQSGTETKRKLEVLTREVYVDNEVAYYKSSWMDSMEYSSTNLDILKRTRVYELTT